MLEAMFTDWFVQPGSIEEAVTEVAKVCSPQVAKRLAGRACDELNDATVVRNPLLTLRLALAAGRFATQTDYYHWAARRTGRWIQAHGLGRANALLGFVRNLDPELLQHARQHGIRTVGDQIIAPAMIEIEEARQQAERWPGWQKQSDIDDLLPVVEWERRTWRHLDQILCMSEYVREGLLDEGVPEERIRLLPYPVNATRFNVADRRGRRGPVTVGFVGAVNLRKGAPYFFEVARRFDPAQVRFVMIGKTELEPAILEQHRGHVEMIGRIPRAEINRHLDEFDIFFFPSTCEGSAGAVVEAMAAGLPVVTTFNSGTLARHGSDALIVRNGDVAGFVEAITQLVENAELRYDLGHAARERVEQFNLDWYTAELAAIFEQLVTR